MEGADQRYEIDEGKVSCMIAAPQNFNKVLEAIQMAIKAHDGVSDRLGKPTILHALRVGAMGRSQDEQIVGFLHDTLEDTKLKRGAIDFAFGPRVGQAIVFITRVPNVFNYGEYLNFVKYDPLSVAVKINDLIDNLRRLEELPLHEQKSLGNRYRRALAFLRGERDEF
jgi:(p)ppGpp synthase/HD superfamily hydrolase